MKLSRPTAEIFVPDGVPVADALARTTHLGIGAHQDDLEIMAMEGILAGFGRDDRWFTGVIVTDGAGSSRDGLYASYTDDQMRQVRRREQKKAAYLGEFSSVVFLDHSSAAVKDPANPAPGADLDALLAVMRPGSVYTHNLADKHPTHVAVGLRTLEALRRTAPGFTPDRVLGCEVWRDLDWMLDSDKVVMELDEHESISHALVAVFDSQIVGGKRYDLATMGRRRAHATYSESHATDAALMVNFAMDLTPLVRDPSANIVAHVEAHLARFAGSVRDALERHAGP